MIVGLPYYSLWDIGTNRQGQSESWIPNTYMTKTVPTPERLISDRDVFPVKSGGGVRDVPYPRPREHSRSVFAKPNVHGIDLVDMS